MSRTSFFVLLVFIGLKSHAQHSSVSFGIYTGLTASFTSDDGIKKDPRYEGRFEAKFAPVGVNIGLDYETFGIMLSPGLINIGQNFYVVNTQGGQDGMRKIDLKYLTVPLSFRIHLIHFVTFKLSALASISPSFLLQGKESIGHQATKLDFPQEVYPILPPNYTIEYDGVLAPEMSNLNIAEKKDFRPIQLFAGAGFRSDWDPSNFWRISVDLRVNYGLFDPRTEQYTKDQESKLSLYQIHGQRREFFAQFTVGISRYIEFEKSEKERKKKLKGTTKKYRPTQYPGQRTRQSRPKD
ncbi:outer membrane beta-barrel protein [Chryseolinea sp. H1M3-3]|uniref:outer membrane beta-barrel protein n=1 Tax=Chryseolinea sp. H1M3-3 TaxID=3034144 RepID=UPI0023EDFA6D|nr:outer membrane beta-barrel protein [Chryseolinea sp. H1M3-3]